MTTLHMSDDRSPLVMSIVFDAESQSAELSTNIEELSKQQLSDSAELIATCMAYLQATFATDQAQLMQNQIMQLLDEA